MLRWFAASLFHCFAGSLLRRLGISIKKLTLPINYYCLPIDK